MQTITTNKRQPQPAFPFWLPVIMHLYNYRPAQDIMQRMPPENKCHQEAEEKGKCGKPVTDASDTSTDPSQILSVPRDNADSKNAFPDRLLPIGRKVRKVVQYHKNKSKCQHRRKPHKPGGKERERHRLAPEPVPDEGCRKEKKLHYE
jgi:hypothetical protein